MLQPKVIEKIKTHILCSVTFFSENHAVYEIMSKNVVEPEATNDVTIWRIRVACWISRSTSIHARAHAHAPRHPYSRTHTQPHM
jgi:hypothetical protein